MEYFRQNEWESSWIKQADKLVRDEFLATYQIEEDKVGTARKDQVPVYCNRGVVY